MKLYTYLLLGFCAFVLQTGHAMQHDLEDSLVNLRKALSLLADSLKGSSGEPQVIEPQPIVPLQPIQPLKPVIHPPIESMKEQPYIEAQKITSVGLQTAINDLIKVKKNKSDDEEAKLKRYAQALSYFEGIKKFVATGKTFTPDQKAKLKEALLVIVDIDPLLIEYVPDVLKNVGYPDAEIYDIIVTKYKSIYADIEKYWKSFEKLTGILPMGLRMDFDEGIGYAAKLFTIKEEAQKKGNDPKAQQFVKEVDETLQKILDLLTGVGKAKKEQLIKQGIDIDAYINMLKKKKQSFCASDLYLKHKKGEQLNEVFYPFAQDLADLERLCKLYQHTMRSLKHNTLEAIVDKINGFYEYGVPTSTGHCKACVNYERAMLIAMKNGLKKESPEAVIQKILTGNPGMSQYGNWQERGGIREIQLEKPVFDQKGDIVYDSSGQQKKVWLDASDVVDYEQVLDNLKIFLIEINKKEKDADKKRILEDIITRKIPAIINVITNGCH